MFFALCLILFVFAVFSFKSPLGRELYERYKSTSRTFVPPAPKVNVTLNGVEEKEACAMIEHFNKIKANDTHPLPTSVWFDKSTIDAIVNLLHKEQATDLKNQKPNAKDKQFGITDGIRIYFACDKSANQYPLQTTILLISTKDNGPSTDPTCWSKRLHKNYFEHTIDVQTLKDYKVCHDGVKCGGDRLYKFCFPCLSDPFCKLPGNHHMDKAKARWMVKSFEVHYHSINTKSEWFDLGVFENISTSARAKGMRFYFGTHLKNKKDSLRLRDALIVTPTEYNKRAKTDDDYFDCKETKTYWLDYFKHYHKYLYSYSSQAQDNGELCPSNCD